MVGWVNFLNTLEHIIEQPFEFRLYKNFFFEHIEIKLRFIFFSMKEICLKAKQCILNLFSLNTSCAPCGIKNLLWFN